MKQVEADITIDGVPFTIRVSDRNCSSYPLRIRLVQPRDLLWDKRVTTGISRVDADEFERNIRKMIESQLTNTEEVEELLDDTLDKMEREFDKLEVD